MNEGAPIIIKKKKGHGGHGHHGGSWKVAYADFVTAMMAFFMVMWIMGLSDETRAQIQGYFNDPNGFMKNIPSSKDILNMHSAPPQSKKARKVTEESFGSERDKMKSLEKKLQDAVSGGGGAGKGNVGGLNLEELSKQVQITMTQEGLQIELVESTGAVFFESGSATVRPIARALVEKITPLLVKSGRPIIIEGHTDAKKYPSLSYTNMDLSADRAGSIHRLLTADGMPDEQIIQVRGYGATKLKKPEDPFHFSNRRVTLLLPFKDLTDPTLDLPKEAFEKEKQAAFRAPLFIKPDQPNISTPTPHRLLK